jgi:hypothetical protein
MECGITRFPVIRFWIWQASMFFCLHPAWVKFDTFPRNAIQSLRSRKDKTDNERRMMQKQQVKPLCLHVSHTKVLNEFRSNVGLVLVCALLRCVVFNVIPCISHGPYTHVFLYDYTITSISFTSSFRQCCITIWVTRFLSIKVCMCTLQRSLQVLVIIY